MKKQFEGKTIFITGGATGIGKETALSFAEEGANIALADVNIEKGEETVNIIKKNNGNAHFIEMDVTDPAQIEAAIENTVKTFGSLDFAFNNAGVVSNEAKFTADFPIDEFKRTMDINFMGVWYCMRAEIKEMLKNGKGVIINTASILGTVGMATAAPYVASKHAVIGLTKTAAIEYATKGIRINALCPGYIETPMLTPNDIVKGTKKYDYIANLHAMKRLGKVEEIASAVVFMCSDKASFMTGHSMIIDGGYTAK